MTSPAQCTIYSAYAVHCDWHVSDRHLCCLQGLLSKEDLHVNMCDALANLPTDLGLEAIETFSRRASSEPVRNKTGFMVELHPDLLFHSPEVIQQLDLIA